MNLPRWTCLMLALNATCSAFASVVPHTSSSRHEIPAIGRPRDAEIRAQLSALISTQGVTAMGIGVIKTGRLVWTGYFGEQSPGVPTSRTTLFNVASLTKTVTAETILRLAAKGKIDVDESMASFWIDPDIASDPRYVLLTPRMALTHTTGFPNWRFFLPDRHLRFLHDPGSTFGYSGEGFEYVARYAEKKLNRRFEDLVKAEVFKPDRVADVAFSPRADLFNRIAVVTDDKGTHKPYCRPGGWCRPEGQWSAAADMVVSVESYAKFLVGVMHARHLTPSLARERIRIQAVTNDEFAVGDCAREHPVRSPKAQGYGLGWEVIDFGDEQLVGHTGSDWSEVATAYFYTRSRDGLVIFLSGPNLADLDVMAKAIRTIDPDSVMPARFERWHAAEMQQHKN